MEAVYRHDVRGLIPSRDNIFIFTVASRPAQGPTKFPIQWVPGAISQTVKRQGLEAGYSPPSTAEVENGGAIPSLSHISSWGSV
jgi:hypothetical protein